MPQCSRSATACARPASAATSSSWTPSTATKIRGKYLRALEEERFELLPSHTYIKGFLRSYADYLGLDGQLYVDEYNSRFVVGEEEAPVRARARARRASEAPDRRESSIVVFALAAIAVVTALVIVAWTLRQPGGRARARPEDVDRPQQRPAAQPPQAAGTARLELRRDARRLVPARQEEQRLSARSSTRGRSSAARSSGSTARCSGCGSSRRRTCSSAATATACRLPAAVKAQGVFVTAKKIFAADAA